MEPWNQTEVYRMAENIFLIGVGFSSLTFSASLSDQKTVASDYVLAEQ